MALAAATQDVIFILQMLEEMSLTTEEPVPILESRPQRMSPQARQSTLILDITLFAQW